MIEILQDAAGVIERTPEKRAAFFTDKIATCVVRVFECEAGTIMIHDSGQLRINEIADLVSEYGPVKALHSIRPIISSSLRGKALKNAQENVRHHKARLDTLIKRLKTKGKFPVHLHDALDREGYAASFTEAEGLTVRTDRPSDVTAIPHADKHQALLELNNCFAPLNQQDLPLQVQFKNGEHAPVPPPIYPLKEMLQLFEQQVRFFHINLGFLLKAHEVGVIQLSEAFLAATNGVRAGVESSIEHAAFMQRLKAASQTQ